MPQAEKQKDDKEVTPSSSLAISKTKKISSIRVVKAGSAPDVDSDFHTAYRDKAVEHVEELYGRGTVSNIITFSSLGAKAAFKLMCTIYDIPFSEANKVSSLVPPPIEGVECSLNNIFDNTSDRYIEGSDFRNAVSGDKWTTVIEGAKAIEGKIRGTGVHACGIIMSSEPLENIVPMHIRQSDGRVISQWTYQDLEALGLLKFDFLGLDTVDLISHTVEYIKKSDKETPNMLEIIHGSMDDQKTFEMLSRGETDGIFQLASSGVKELLQRMKPTQFDDIVATTALYRPGPMGMNSHVKYADRKNGREKVQFPIHPDFKGSVLEKILEKTQGLCVPKGTPILDSKTGLYVPIEKITPNVFYTPSRNNDASFSSKKAVNVINTGFKNVVEIIANGNRKVRVSETHPMLTDKGYIPAGELKQGDKLAVVDSSLTDVVDNRNILNSDTSYFLGAMLGDGSMVSQSSPYFTNSDEDIRSEVIKIVNENFKNIKPKRTLRYRNKIEFTQQVAFYDSRNAVGKYDRKQIDTARDRNSVQIWLKKLGYDGRVLMYDKTVTNEVLQTNNENLKNLIAGLWDTDGTVGKNAVHFTTTSENLYSSVKNILIRLGVDFGVSETPYHNEKRKDRTAYRIYPTLLDFKETIQPHLRSNKKDFIINRSGRGSQGVGRTIGLAIVDLNEWLNKNVIELDFFSNEAQDRFKNKSIIGLKAFKTYYFNKFGKILRVKQDIIDALRDLEILSTDTISLMNTRFRYVKTVSHVGRIECYDIEVEDNHNFIVDGFITHNCIYQEQVMQIANQIGGMTLQEGDDLRKAMGKKKKDVMAKMRPIFINGGTQNGFSEEGLQTLWATMEVFAEYGFNKCLDGRTLVALENGGKIRIEDLKKRTDSGESVRILSMFEDGQLKPHTVKKVVKSGRKPLFKIRTKNGRIVRITEDHRLLTTGGYGTIADGALSVGTELIVDEEWTKRNEKKKELNNNTISLNTINHNRFTDPRFDHSGEAVRSLVKKYLTARNVSFETNKKLNNLVNDDHPQFSDFYINGLYFEMDGMARGRDYFRDEKYGDSLPFVYMTPFNYKDVIDEALMSHHCENGDEIVAIESPKVLETGSILNEMTYDIEMEDTGPSNFVANGIVSHNSHSVAYAMMAYQSAFLKAHYPVEFMAALISQNVGKKEKILAFLQETNRMKIKVGTADINTSDVYVSPDYENKTEYDIVYGLSGIEAVSEDIAKIIVSEREENGDFDSIQNVILRCHPIGVSNKRIYENLALSGAFDSFGFSRRAIVENVTHMMDDTKVQSTKGSVSLFDMLGDDNPVSTAVDLAGFDEYPYLEKLQRESSVIGLHLTGHPLDNVGSFHGLRNATIGSIIKNRKKGTYKIVGSINEITTKRNKRGGKSISISVDDGSGFVTAFLSQGIVKGIDKKIAQDKIRSLYVSGASEVSTSILEQAFDEKNVATNETQIGQVYSIEIMFRPGFDDNPDNFRITKMTKLSLNYDGSLPVRIRLNKPRTQEEQKEQASFVKALAKKYPGDSTIQIAYKDTLLDANSDEMYRDAVYDMKNSEAIEIIEEEVETRKSLSGDTHEHRNKKKAKKKDDQKKDYRSWPPESRKDTGILNTKSSRKIDVRDIDAEALDYKPTKFSVNKDNDLARAIENSVGIENYDFGVFNTDILDDVRN